MPKQSSNWKQNPKVVEQIEDYGLRVQNQSAADLLWVRVLTGKERQRLGNDLAACWSQGGTIGIWMRLHRVSRPRAILEVARAIGLLSESNYNWLLREIGEHRRDNKTEIPQLEYPVWDKDSGTLHWKGRAIRKVRLMKRPSDLQRILEAFDNAKWKVRIGNPLPTENLNLHATLRTLNKRLKHIRFHSHQGGQAITWALC